MYIYVQVHQKIDGNVINQLMQWSESNRTIKIDSEMMCKHNFLAVQYLKFAKVY